MTLALILFIALQLADYLTTLRGLRAGGREANPVMAALFRKVKPELGLALVKLAIVAVVGALVLFDAIYMELFVAVAIYAAIVANNLYQIRKAR